MCLDCRSGRQNSLDLYLLANEGKKTRGGKKVRTALFHRVGPLFPFHSCDWQWGKVFYFPPLCITFEAWTPVLLHYSFVLIRVFEDDALYIQFVGLLFPPRD